MSGSRIIKSLCQEDQCNIKEGLNKLKQCCWRSFFFFWRSKDFLSRGGTIIMQNYTIPGGHDMHPSEPWEEALENVPTGHGRKNQKSSFCSGVCVNPDASRAEIQTFPFWDSGRGTAIDSVSDKYGFLKRILQEKKRKNQDSKSCESFCSKPF